MTRANGALADDAQAVYVWRHDQGWTQEQAAQWAGVSVRTWRRWESADGHRPRALFEKMARRDGRMRARARDNARTAK